MKKFFVLSVLSFLILTAGFRKKATDLFHKPSSWPAPVYDFRKNPLAEKKIELGRVLFYDPILSRDNTISCASCHSPYNSFTHVDHSLSHGIDNKIGTRNSPVLVNLAWNKRFMWDGSVNDLDLQARMPICNADEMDETMENVVSKLQSSIRYPSLFYGAFGDSAVTDTLLLKSLAQFMLTLVSANSKYDRVMNREESFTEIEQKGYVLFQQKCSSCHSEPLFTNGGFENNGLIPDEELKDMGRMKISKKAADSLKFKVPTLRNIEFSGPYMHDGRFKTLSQVLNNYSMGIQHSPTLSPQLQKGIYLNPNQKVELIAFLLTLSDKEFMFNPKFTYPKNSL